MARTRSHSPVFASGYGVAHSRCRKPDQAFDELLTHSTFILSRLDPNIDRLYDRILGRARAAILRVHRHQLVEVSCDDGFEVAGRHHRADPVGDLVVASVSLCQLARLANDGAFDRDAWNTLVAVRLGEIPSGEIDDRKGHQIRAQTSRLGRRLACLVDAA